MSALHELCASEIRKRVAERSVSAEEVARAHLDRIAAVEPKVDAFLCVLAERALESARRVDRDLAAGRPPGALAGVPVAIKDVLDLEGLPTTCGSRILEGYRPPFTATAVRRLEAAGAVIVGKTNMDEFAMGSSTENSGYKTTRNPWDLTRVPGRLLGRLRRRGGRRRWRPLALGTDTGGSIRQPAALCGIVGLKPTYGRVSRYGLVAFASSLDQIGPFARTVEDAGPLRLGALRPRSLRLHERAAARARLRGGPARGRPRPAHRRALGLPEGGRRGADPAAPSARPLGALEKARAPPWSRSRCPTSPTPSRPTTSWPPPRPRATWPATTACATGGGEAAADLKAMYGDTRDHGFGPEVKRRIILGTFVLSSGYYDAYYLRAQKVRTLIRRDFEAAFEACDVVATPTTPTPAFRLGEKTDDPLQMYLADIFTVPANLAGIPGLSVAVRAWRAGCPWACSSWVARGARPTSCAPPPPTKR